MRFKPLGRTGLFVSEMCLGTMTFGQAGGRYAAASGVLQETVDAILRTAIDAGVNFIDTANVYADGQAEEILGRALKNVGVARKDVVLATKFEHATGTGPNDGGGSRVHIVEAAKASLKRLGTEYIDLYQMHGFDPATPIEETIRALDDLVRQGHVRYVGVSNWAAWQVARALGISDRLGAVRFQSYQGYYSLVGRDIEREVAPMLAAEGLGLIAFSPLAGGYLTGKYRNGVNSGRRATIQFPPVDEANGDRALAILDSVAASHHASMGSVALAWLLQQPLLTSVILGVKDVDQLKANLAASDIGLTQPDLAALNEAVSLSPEYPGWMLQQGSAARAALLKVGSLPRQD